MCFSRIGYRKMAVDASHGQSEKPATQWLQSNRLNENDKFMK